MVVQDNSDDVNHIEEIEKTRTTDNLESQSPLQNEVAEEDCVDWESRAYEYEDQIKRLAADRENYRKRVEKEQGNFQLYATEKVFRDLLPIVDSLDMAEDILTTKQDIPSVLESLRTINLQLHGVLSRNSVHVIDALNKPFDPQLHKAMKLIERDNDHHSNVDVVSKIWQKGYSIGARTLRPALVEITKAQIRQDEGIKAEAHEENQTF